MGKYNVQSKNVKIRIKKNQIPKFLAALPKGFDVTIYPVDKKNKKQYYADDIRNVTFSVTDRFPDPKFRHYGEDIDKFLSNIHKIDPRIKLLNDKVKPNDEQKLMTEPWIKIETLLDKPGMHNSDMEKYTSKAKDVREVQIRASEINKLHKHYDKMKSEFIKTHFKKEDVKDTEERDPNTGEKLYTVRQGEI